MLDVYRRSFAMPYETVVRTIREKLFLELTGRPAKSTSAIVEKLQRESIRLSQLQDIAGCRIITHDIASQNNLIGQMTQLFPAARAIDRRIAPSHGYRAVHVIPLVNGMGIEVQVRTALQHIWAELSEKLADVLDPSVKYGGGPDDVRNDLARTSQLIARIESHEELLLQFETNRGALPPDGLREFDHALEEFERIKAELGEILRELAERHTGGRV